MTVLSLSYTSWDNHTQRFCLFVTLSLQPSQKIDTEFEWHSVKERHLKGVIQFFWANETWGSMDFVR